MSSTIRGTMTFCGSQPMPGTIDITDDGWVRFASDDGRSRTMVRREALETGSIGWVPDVEGFHFLGYLKETE